MNRKIILTVLLFAGVALLSACSAVNTQPFGTPVPTLFAAPALPPVVSGDYAIRSDACAVYAVDLLGAWAAAGAPENEAFPFTAVTGAECTGNFDADVLPLFQTANLWYTGSPACKNCHNTDLIVSYAQMDLSSYAGILAGSRRTSPDATGNDILGIRESKAWDKTTLYNQINIKRMPPGLPVEAGSKGPLVMAGTQK